MKDDKLQTGVEYPLFTTQAKPFEDRYSRGLREVRNLHIEPIGLSIPLEVKATITDGRTMDSIMPYGNGYKFDIRDTTLTGRVEKTTSLPRSDFLLQEFPDNPYVLEFYADEHTLGELGFSREIPYHSQYSRDHKKFMRWHLKGPAREVLDRLRIEVMFPGEEPDDSSQLEIDQPIVQPGGMYQTKPDSFLLTDAYILMHKFYPTDIGPLPLTTDMEGELNDRILERFETDLEKMLINPEDITFWEGLKLRLPKNPKQLFAAQMRFRLISDEEKAFASNTRA